MKRKTIIVLLLLASFFGAVEAQTIIGRFDYDSLRASNVLCTYGTYNNFNSPSGTYRGPLADTGIIDYGPTVYGSNTNPYGSRHTVHRDTAKRDSISFDSVRCIPRGKMTSVRMGCAYGSYYCEAITYTFSVDTTLNDLLVLNLAPIMTNPQHPNNQQPRVYIQILDTNDTQLGFIDLVSAGVSATGSLSRLPLNWVSIINCNEPVVYINWMPLGIALSQYHGQTVKLRLANYSCGQGGPRHFSYVYYTVDYDNLVLATTPVLAKTNGLTFSAPAGFMKYEWFLNSAPAVLFDSVQTVTIPRGEDFTCIVTDYLGHSKTFAAKSVKTLPHSNFTMQVKSTDCESRKLELTNLAYVTDSLSRPVTNGVERFQWIFDNNQLCYMSNPKIDVTPGWHTISLVAQSGTVSDTLTRRIRVSDSIYIDSVYYDTLQEGQTLNFHGRTLDESGIYRDTTLISGSCFRVETLRLYVNKQSGIEQAKGDIFEIFPNPAKSQITIEDCSVAKAEIIDNSGRILKTVYGTKTINISSLPSGIYTLRITSSENQCSLKHFVKQ